MKNKSLEVVTSSGRLAAVEDALAKPLDFQVSFDLLGWSLRYTDSDYSTLISADDAVRVVLAISKARS
tara:strand:+ start:453 stop:656 length:204 start_codon:yes stop_codon:yes gene_type:complete